MFFGNESTFGLILILTKNIRIFINYYNSIGETDYRDN